MQFFKSNIFKLILLAILLRVLIMPFYFHPDIKTYHFQSSFLKQGVFDIYSYLESNKSDLPLKEEFVYFPLTYFSLGSYQILASPFLGDDFNNWIANAGIGASEQVGAFKYLFILKLPYLSLDILIAFLLMGIFKDERDKKKVFTLWLFNPFSLILIYVFSNVDIFALTLTALSLLFAQKNRLVIAAICLGIGAGFKAYPLVFLPILLLYAKGIKERILITIAGLGAFMLIIAPFISSTAFKQTTLMSGLTTRMFLPVINLGFQETLFIALIPFSLIFFSAWIKDNLDYEHIVYYYFAVLALLFSFIHYHIQWLLWIIPFAIIMAVKRPKLIGYLVLMGVIAFAIPMIYDDKSMSVSLLRPFSLWYEAIPTPYDFVSRVYNANALQSLLHTLLAGASLAVVWNLFRNEQER